MNINSNKFPKAADQNVNDVSRISQGTSIKGDIQSATDLRVDGRVDGVLYSEGRIVAGESSRLAGKVLCSNADVWGRIDGDVYIKDLLTLKSSSEVNGNIYVHRIQVEIGVQINGSIKMISEQDYEQYVKTLVLKNAEQPAAPRPVQKPKYITAAPKKVEQPAVVVEVPTGQQAS